ncbi:hypothetical protein BCR34DRAFT_600600 [Clohesyomyces aquaticus]|uniref:Uncharacterized protein n=1 Tax=Clohesyomyces aquaticus TaxID=1231657 RepID=A0A1Y1ZQM7_9PLEO|nr:hypothetical protein BCR34DRAFT_600600 [Clohesyomyces aquaticus]
MAGSTQKPGIASPAGQERETLVARLCQSTPELPEGLMEEPVAVECTELYLDERAFNEHAGSAEYLAAYGKVVDPSLQNSTTTARMGNPSEFLVVRILAPMLKERVRDVGRGMWVWRRLEGRGREILVALDLDVEDG